MYSAKSESDFDRHFKMSEAYDSIRREIFYNFLIALIIQKEIFGLNKTFITGCPIACYAS
jgi:hypothetical protein